MSLRERFEAKVSHEPTSGCWLWTGYCEPAGYGRIGVGAAPDRAHRVSYRLNVGAIPDGMCVCHRCDNRACVNPEHLFLGTVADNNHDCDGKGRRPALRGARHGMSKLTAEQVAEIRRRFDAGEAQSELRRAFGMSKAQISKLCRMQSWVQ